jgi:TatA/E family protein of Tat protein translocase
MFDQPWQWAIVLVVVLVLFGGTRIRDVMGGLSSGIRLFRNKLQGAAGIGPEMPKSEVGLQRGEARQSDPRIARPRRSGRNLHGVPVYTGTLRLPEPHVAARITRRAKAWLVFTSVVFECIFIVPSGSRLAGFVSIGLITGLFGSAWSVVDWFHVCSVRKFARLVSIRDLSARTGRPELSYLLSAREQGIEPRCIIDCEEYFDADDLGEAAILLRPAEGIQAGSLLRPTDAQNRSDSNLLTPCDSDSNRA